MQMFDRNTPISIRITLISSETVAEAQWKTALSENAFVNVLQREHLCALADRAVEGCQYV